MTEPRDRIAAALSAALATDAEGALAGTALGIAEALADQGVLDLDDLRLRDLVVAPEPGSAGLLVAAVPFGLATPLDRPRLRRDAYRYAAATGADEGAAIAAVGTALVAADLTRFDATMTAIRVRQSLLEDAPMALLNRFQLLVEEAERSAAADDDPGAVLQVALSAASWRDGDGVTATLAALDDGEGRVARVLAAIFAALRAGTCDAPVEADVARGAGAVADRLASLAAPSAA